MQELLQVPLFRAGGEVEFALLVVGLDEVLQDGTGLPQSEVGVGVNDGGEAAIRVDIEIELGLGVRNSNLIERRSEKR
jgi:hypothetical protein